MSLCNYYTYRSCCSGVPPRSNGTNLTGATPRTQASAGVPPQAKACLCAVHVLTVRASCSTTTHTGVAAREFLLEVTAQTSRELLLVCRHLREFPPRQGMSLCGACPHSTSVLFNYYTYRSCCSGVPPRSNRYNNNNNNNNNNVQQPERRR